MELTDLQKKIIIAINDRKIKDITTFIKWCDEFNSFNIISNLGNVIDNENNSYSLSNLQYTTKEKKTISIYTGEFSDPKEVFFVENFDKIGEFLAIWHKLEKMDYILTLNIGVNSRRLLYYLKRKRVTDLSTTFNGNITQDLKKLFDAQKKAIHKIKEDTGVDLTLEDLNSIIKSIREDEKIEKQFDFNTLVKWNNEFTKNKKVKYIENKFYLKLNHSLIKYVGDFISKELIVLPDLKVFIDNGFQTYEEIIIHEEVKDRKKAQLCTIIIALISVFTSFANSYFQYKRTQVSFEDTRQFWIKEQKTINRKLEAIYDKEDEANKVLRNIDNKTEKFMDATLKTIANYIERNMN